MKRIFVGIFLLSCACFIGVYGQNTTEKDSIKTIEQRTYKTGSILSVHKVSHYDSNQILIQEDRKHYLKLDTGLWVNKHYQYTYNPKTQLGGFYTNHYKKDGSSLQKNIANFKSYKHSKIKHIWTKHYAKSKQLLRYTEHKYDDKGFLIDARTKDYSYDPVMVHTEIVDRNNLGLMIKWESFDEDEAGKRKVREANWVYQDDSILLKTSGYVFNDWNETIQKFNKKTGLIKKKILTYGYRQDNGKIKRNHKNITIYKNGQPFKQIERQYKKKYATHFYTYEGSITKHRIDYKDKKKEDELHVVTRQLDSLGREIAYEEGLNGKIVERRKKIYTKTGQLKENITIKYRKNGSISTTTIRYNKEGKIENKTLKVDDRIIREEQYTYIYYTTQEQKKEE